MQDSHSILARLSSHVAPRRLTSAEVTVKGSGGMGNESNGLASRFVPLALLSSGCSWESSVVWLYIQPLICSFKALVLSSDNEPMVSPNGVHTRLSISGVDDSISINWRSAWHVHVELRCIAQASGLSNAVDSAPSSASANETSTSSPLRGTVIRHV